MSSETLHDLPYGEAEYAGEVQVAASDRPWMEGILGCEWPDEADEPEWLERVNGLVRLGSINMRLLTVQEHDARHDAILSARREYFHLLRRLPEDHDLRARDGLTAPEISLAPAPFIEMQRLLFERGVNGWQFIGNYSRHMLRTAPGLALWLDKVSSYGLDAARILDTTPSVIGLAPESIAERLQPMVAAARSAGVDDYRQAAIDFVSHDSSVLTYKPGKSRVLTRIAVDHSLVPDDWRRLRSLYITPLRDTVVAHIEHGNVIRSLEGLLYHANRNGRCRDDKEILGVIAMHADSGDAVVSEFLRNFPIDDIEAAKAVYQRHVRSRDRRKDMPLLWPGPALLGDAENLSSFQAYKSVIESPELTDEDIIELAGYAAEGVEADHELRRLDIAHDPDQIDDKSRQVDRGLAARRALIARHLGVVVELAESCKSVAAKSDLVAVGNVALATFVLEEYRPQPDQDEPDRFRRRAILTVMRYINGQNPRYQGLTLADLEKLWPDEAQDDN